MQIISILYTLIQIMVTSGAKKQDENAEYDKLQASNGSSSL